MVEGEVSSKDFEMIQKIAGNIDAGRLNQNSDTPLLSDEEDKSDFQLIDETPEEAKKRDAKKERQEKEAIKRAQEEAKKDVPDLFTEETGKRNESNIDKNKKEV